MNEHGWPEHDDDPHGHHDPGHGDPQDPGLVAGLDPDDQVYDDEPVQFPAADPPPDPLPADPPAEPQADLQAPAWEAAEPAATGVGAAGADPDALPGDADPVPPFPPAVDVGALPEPVDGFPWIDTGSLGPVDPAAPAAPAGPVTAQELADHAAADLPPGADPWAVLAGSDDPATAALARWWAEPGT